MDTPNPEDAGAVVVKAKPTRKVFKGATRTINKIPANILNDPQINVRQLKLSYLKILIR